ncbi:metal ABC transporter ATP-binding protein [Janibacter cremeus]|uniref:Zinc transport system ATP-binding protein n=1 Tax=Janibacter cremeus TaxID=1285192 RepID=A0A852VTU8_9MICO|nr:metal ABC transporter ATP-binding protein [Janibacter cremeus]NYF99429.1 zinc transport system ATP-binding protein [Janibacter cremeus]
MSDPTVIELRGAAFGHEDRTVVSDIDLTVRQGEVVAVLGPNGAGKSTLVKGLLGLVELQAGSARVLGSPIGSRPAHNGIGYVPQRHTLASAVKATAAEIVTMGRTVRTPWWAPWRIRSAGNRAIVREALAVVGLGTLAAHDVATLSGGQQRRVLIARALASRPEVFLMDEPTAGVDRGHQQVLVAVMRRLVERGATLVVVTHELDALADLVTRAVVVSGGRISHDGPPEEIAPHAVDHTHHVGEDEPPPSPVPTTFLPTTGGPR